MTNTPQQDVSILDRVRPVSEAGPIKMLIYGPPGAGKTVLAASAPNPLMVNNEHGLRSLLNHPELRHLPSLPVGSFNDLDRLFWELHAGKAPDRESIVLDGFGELQKRQLDEQIDGAFAANSRNRTKFLPQQQDYLINTEVMRRLVWSFRELPRHLIFTCHDREEKDETTGMVTIRPDLPQKLSKTLEGIFDVVGYMTCDWAAGPDGNPVLVRRLQIMPDRRVHAKTRIGNLPPVLENPTFQQFIDAQAHEAGREQVVTDVNI